MSSPGAGISLMHMALAFVVAHPALTAAIIGPRTMKQLDGLLAGDEVTLSDDFLDRIDEIVPSVIGVAPLEGSLFAALDHQTVTAPPDNHGAGGGLR